MDGGYLQLEGHVVDIAWIRTWLDLVRTEHHLLSEYHASKCNEVRLYDRIMTRSSIGFAIYTRYDKRK